MSQEFVVRKEHDLPATPEQVWEAVATGSGNLRWVFPMEIEPRVGGYVSRGPCTVTVWDPPSEFACFFENNEGLTAVMEYHIKANDDGTTFLRNIVHRVNNGAVDDDWDAKAAQADRYTALFNHTLDQYLRYFNGRPASYVAATAPAVSVQMEAFRVLRGALGLSDDAAVGDVVRIELPGRDPTDSVVDYLQDEFIGVRSADSLYRFFDRWAGHVPVDAAHHVFAEGTDQETAEETWRVWLESVFA